MTGASIRVKNQQLEYVCSIQYSMQFEGHFIIQTLLDSGNNVNAMTPAYATIFGLPICSTDIGAQKINKSTLLIYGILLANFQLEDK